MSDGLPFNPSRLRRGRLKAFSSEEAAFRVGMWARAAFFQQRAALTWCEKNGLAITKAQAEGTNVAGGFLAPDELIRVIYALREKYGIFRSCARIIPMASDAASIPRRDTGVTAYFPGENGAITASQGTFSNVGLSAKKMATLIRGSSEWDEDAVIDLAEWLAHEIAFAFANKEDDIGFNGTATSAYGGMTGIGPKILDGTHDAGKVVAASGHDTFTEIDTTDLTNLMGKLPAFALPGAAWFSSQMGFATVFCRLASTAGGIIMQNGLPTFLGFPVRVTQVLPQVTTDLSGSVMLLFGDLSLAATLGERRGVTISRSEGRYLELDQIAWRGTERVDINVHDAGDNSTAGPIVGLVGE